MIRVDQRKGKRKAELEEKESIVKRERMNYKPNQTNQTKPKNKSSERKKEKRIAAGLGQMMANMKQYFNVTITLT